jgi:uncharacterized membrane protein (UPF0127 family)
VTGRPASPAPVFGPGEQTLLADGRPVAPLAVARTSAERRRGLLGTSGVEGALWLTRCPSVHMVGMAYPIDVAVLDADGRVLRTATLRPPWGMTFWRWRARTTVEAPAGALAQWGVQVGSRLEIAPQA